MQLTPLQREFLGMIIRKAWVSYCLETGNTKASHIAPWEELNEWDKEADRRIADAVMAHIGIAVTLQIEDHE